MIQEMIIIDNQMQVILTGSIYLEDANEMGKTLTSIIEDGQTSFLIDMSQVDYIDSTGLGVLISIRKRAMHKGGGVKIRGLQGLVKELFELTRLSTVFDIQQ